MAKQVEVAQNVPPAFPAALKQARKAMGLSVEEAAELCKRSRSTWYAWESGDRAPVPSEFTLIAKKMRTSVAVLFGEAK